MKFQPFGFTYSSPRRGFPLKEQNQEALRILSSLFHEGKGLTQAWTWPSYFLQPFLSN